MNKTTGRNLDRDGLDTGASPAWLSARSATGFGDLRTRLPSFVTPTGEGEPINVNGLREGRNLGAPRYKSGACSFAPWLRRLAAGAPHGAPRRFREGLEKWATRTPNVIVRGARQRRAAAGQSCGSLTLARDHRTRPRAARACRRRALAVPLPSATSESAAQTPRTRGWARWPCPPSTSLRARRGPRQPYSA